MGRVFLHPTKRQNATLSDFCRNCKPALSFFMSLQLMAVSTRRTSKTKRLKNAAVGCMRNARGNYDVIPFVARENRCSSQSRISFRWSSLLDHVVSAKNGGITS